MLTELGLIDNLIQMVYKDSLEVQREAVWSLSNATACKHPELISVFVKKDIIKSMATWLRSKDSKTLVVLLEGFGNILEVGMELFGKEQNEFCQHFENCGALDALEDL